jgi:hypothetical protein
MYTRKEYHREYYVKNREKILEYTRNHQEKPKVRQRRREYAREYMKEYRKKNKDKKYHKVYDLIRNNMPEKDFFLKKQIETLEEEKQRLQNL